MPILGQRSQLLVSIPFRRCGRGVALCWIGAFLIAAVPALAGKGKAEKSLAATAAEPAEPAEAREPGGDEEKARAAIIHLTGMTYTTSQGDRNELLLHAEKARYNATAGLAHLHTVRAEVAEAEDREGFEMTCERGRLNLKNNNFHAEGDVVGKTAGGRLFAAPWVRFDHSRGMLYTDAPVTITESTGTYRGGGFQYFVHEGRFKLLGGATVVQEER